MPACAFVYAVKFVCGVQNECGCGCAPVQPGPYATEINIHNYAFKPIHVLKRFIPVVLAGAPPDESPGQRRVYAKTPSSSRRSPPPWTTVAASCSSLSPRFRLRLSLVLGFVELTAAAELAVTAVYTSCGLKTGGVSIEVEQIAAQR